MHMYHVHVRYNGPYLKWQIGIERDNMLALVSVPDRPVIFATGLCRTERQCCSATVHGKATKEVTPQNRATIWHARVSPAFGWMNCRTK